MNIPGSDPLELHPQPAGSSSELYSYTSDTLTPQAIASSRLTVPFNSASSSKAADRLKAQNAAHDKERKDRAQRVKGEKKAIPPALHLDHSTNMARTTSSPAVPSSAPPTATSTPIVPLKTRVVQLLALGASSVEDIVARVGMSEGEVMRVVRVVSHFKYLNEYSTDGQVGKEVPEGWTLQPNKYSQVKIGQWKYTYAEKMRVLRLAKEAFDELELPEDADERADLDRKEAEVMSGGSSSSERIETPPPAPAPIPVPATIPSPAPTPPKKERVPKKTGLSLIGKQKAKFAAEKRAASLPNVKKVDGTASPRLEQSPSRTIEQRPASLVTKNKELSSSTTQKQTPATKSESTKTRISPAPTTSSEESVKIEKAIKRKREDDSHAPPSKRASSPPKRAEKPKKGTSSSTASSSEEVRGRPTTTKPVVKGPEDRRKRQGRVSRDYSSSEDEEPKEPKKRSQPPLRKTPLDNPQLNGHGEKERPPDPEALRERYEELFPAYEQLSNKLAKLHRDAEAEEEGEVVEMDQRELAKMVAKWEKWHRELEGIRKWFTT